MGLKQTWVCPPLQPTLELGKALDADCKPPIVLLNLPCSALSLPHRNFEIIQICTSYSHNTPISLNDLCVV